MSRELSVKEFSFISYFLFYHNSCNRCAIPDNDVGEDKVGLKVEDEDEEEDRPKKTKEEISKNLRFVKGVMESNNLLP